MNYTGGCHCGRVSFSVETEKPITEVLECNCSICSKRGSLLAFFPRAQFHLKTPESAYATYTFNTHKIKHHFCIVCGIAPFAEAKGPDGRDMAAVNVRCLGGIDIKTLKRNPFDGASR